MKYSPLLSCRQASRLITASFDRPLGPIERLGLRRHLQICSACRTVVRQFDQIRAAMRAWGRGVAEAAAETGDH
jgi:anti-sigma factor RsiW